MRQRGFGALFTGIMIFAIMVWPIAGAGAQDQDDDTAQSTAIADLQTRVAELETVVAPGTSTVLSQPGRPPMSHPGGTPTANILYQADTSGGFEQWTDAYEGGGVNPFVVKDGMLVYPKGFYTILFAPYLTTSPNYVVEAEMRVGTPTGEVASPSAGIMVRYMNDPATAGHDEGYWAGLRWGTSTPPPIYGVIEAEQFRYLSSLDLTGAGLPDPTDSWHTYRFEVNGDHLRYLIDGNEIADVTDDSFSGVGLNGRIGILASGVPLEVRSFRILAG